MHLNAKNNCKTQFALKWKRSAYKWNFFLFTDIECWFKSVHGKSIAWPEITVKRNYRFIFFFVRKFMRSKAIGGRLNSKGIINNQFIITTMSSFTSDCCMLCIHRHSQQIIHTHSVRSNGKKRCENIQT